MRKNKASIKEINNLDPLHCKKCNKEIELNEGNIYRYPYIVFCSKECRKLYQTKYNTEEERRNAHKEAMKRYIDKNRQRLYKKNKMRYYRKRYEK